MKKIKFISQKNVTHAINLITRTTRIEAFQEKEIYLTRTTESS